MIVNNTDIITGIVNTLTDVYMSFSGKRREQISICPLVIVCKLVPDASVYLIVE